MINSQPKSMPKPVRLIVSLALALSACALISCLLDKPKEEVTLTLNHVPDNANRVIVLGVDVTDTLKSPIELDNEDWSPGKILHFSLGAAQGTNWQLRVEAYQDGYLVYKEIIPRGTAASDSVRHLEVTSTWPKAIFKSVKRDSDSVRFVTEFHNVDSDEFWSVHSASDTLFPKAFFHPDTKGFAVAASSINLGARLVLDLHRPDSVLLSVQIPDTLLGDEALAPAGSTVKIATAILDGDSVRLSLALTNFKLPLVDDPTPGEGFPMAHDGKDFRLLPGFHYVGSDITRLVGPVSDLAGVEKLIVALHYTNKMRVRPAAEDTLDVSSSLRTATPTIRILSHTVIGTDLQLILERKNFDGLHCHIYKDMLVWPGSSAYQTCFSDTCYVQASRWQGAKVLIVAAHKNESHDLFRPIVQDSLQAPFTP